MPGRWSTTSERHKGARGAVAPLAGFVISRSSLQGVRAAVQSRIVSAIRWGRTSPFRREGRRGRARGAALQVGVAAGCVITFASFRSTIPPPANTLFGRVPDATMVAACTNPAALGGGSGDLHAYLDKSGRTITSNTPAKPWVTPDQPIDTPWVSVPGLLTAKCASNEHAGGYVEVTGNGNPTDARVDGHRGASAGRPAGKWGSI